MNKDEKGLYLAELMEGHGCSKAWRGGKDSSGQAGNVPGFILGSEDNS